MASQQSLAYVDVHVPLAATERVFLQLAVQAASKKFREKQSEPLGPAEPTINKAAGDIQGTD